ncbi:hypothetical protein OIU78_013111 [Salix suchowensis]|nr:hypothetical protein OIU78_013111 [Salix suchowensis]
MNGTQVCVLKQPNKVCFRCLLKGCHRAALELSEIELGALGFCLLLEKKRERSGF